MADLAYSKQDYLELDLFTGEEANITCRTVKLVKTRKPHACYFGQNGDGHSTAPGDLARHEKALVDGDYWGSYYLCIRCMDRELADLRGDITALEAASKYRDFSR
ncbi:hypothetical protein [Massilia aerilata]|uniref:Uncharacterized protein n=1 Tax=Massilia aerilata TaxID=453817 RepID=A0ABW0S7H8_9BURK